MNKPEIKFDGNKVSYISGDFECFGFMHRDGYDERNPEFYFEVDTVSGPNADDDYETGWETIHEEILDAWCEHLNEQRMTV